MEQITCVNCGNQTPVSRSLSDYRLKNKDGYCRFCEACKPAFDEAVQNISELEGQVFEEGIRVELGKRDPFFRIQLRIPEGEKLPRYVPLEPEEQIGGLMVFLRRCMNHLDQQPEDKFPKVTVPVKIVEKRDTVAIAEPWLDGKE